MGELITTLEAAEIIECTQNWVIALCNDGKLEAQKMHGQWLIDKESVEKYAETTQVVREARRRSHQDEASEA